MAEANFESLNFEISVNAKDAAQSVRLLRDSVVKLDSALRSIAGLRVNTLFAGISESAAKAAAEVKISEEEISRTLAKLYNDIGQKNQYDMMAGMSDIAGTFEQQLAMADSNAAAANWQEQMAAAFQTSSLAIEEAADATYTLSDAMRMVRGAMGSVAPAEVASGFMQISEAADSAAQSAGQQAGQSFRESFIDQGDDLGEQISDKVEKSVTASGVAEGLGASFHNAMVSTKTFTQVTQKLGTATKILSPAMEAAGVSAEAFGAAMSAAGGPITIILLAIQAIIKVINLLIDNFKEFTEVVKKFVKAARDLNERFNPFESMKKELASMLALAKRQVMRRAINAVIKAVTEGLQEGVANLAEFDAEFGATIDSFKNSVGLFKNSIGVAVAPIISYFIPALNTLLAALTSVMNTLARLTALLTGKHTYTIAKGYEEVGKSAGGASGKVKELQRTILGFDEINRLNGNNGSGGGGGGGAGDAISAYETMEVGDWPYDSWGEALLAFTEWLDKTGVPALRRGLGKISSFVNKFSQGLYEALTFDGVQESIANLASDLGDALNNFLNGGAANGGLDWAAMGRAIGMAIQTAFNFAANFLRELDFIALGENIAEFINKAIEQLNPADIADTLFTPIRAAFGLVVGFLSDFDFAAFTEKLGQFVNRFVQNIADAINDVKDWGKIWNNIADGILRFIDTVDWDTLFGTINTIVDGLFEGINTVLSRLEKDGRLKNIIHQFIDIILRIGSEWLKVKLRVVFSALDGFSFGGLLTGHPYMETGGAVGGLGIGHFGIVDAFEQLFNVLDGGVDSVEETNGAIASLKGTADRTASAVSSSGKIIGSSISGIGEAAKGANTMVATATQGMSTQLANLNVNASKPMRELASTANTQFTAVKNSVTNNMSSARTSAVNSAEALRKDVASKFQSAASSANTEFANAKNHIVNNLASAKNSVPSFWDVGSNIKNGVINGMGDFKGQLTNWANQFKSHILKNFAIKSPSRWARDEVGTYLSEGIALGMEQDTSIQDACAGIKEGITSEFDSMSFFGGVSASTSGRSFDVASAIGEQVMAGIASMDSGSQQPIVCEVYLDRDRIATAVTRGQQAQNRRYSPTALAY